MSQFFASGSQIIGASASASVLPMNIQEWFPLGFPLCCPRDSQESFPTSQSKNINSYVLRFLYGPILISMHDYWKKAIILTRRTIVVKAMFLLFNMLSSFVIVFLLRSKHLLISWLQSTCAVILEPPKIKSVTVSIVSPSICHEVMGPDAMIFVFWMLSFKPVFHSPLSLSSRGTLALLLFLP